MAYRSIVRGIHLEPFSECRDRGRRLSLRIVFGISAAPGRLQLAHVNANELTFRRILSWQRPTA